MIIIVMGVSGSGKSTIANLLAEQLNWGFSDADSFHSISNVEKMSQGIPLTEEDRMPWLQSIKHAIDQWLQEGKNMVLACSALKSSYRRFLCPNPELIHLVYLKGSLELIAQRLAKRQNHFMNQALLQSQFDTLEEPDEEIWVDISNPPEVVVQLIRQRLGL